MTPSASPAKGCPGRARGPKVDGVLEQRPGPSSCTRGGLWRRAAHRPSAASRLSTTTDGGTPAVVHVLVKRWRSAQMSAALQPCPWVRVSMARGSSARLNEALREASGDSKDGQLVRSSLEASCHMGRPLVTLEAEHTASEGPLVRIVAERGGMPDSTSDSSFSWPLRAGARAGHRHGRRGSRTSRGDASSTAGPRPASTSLGRGDIVPAGADRAI